jgi:TRAP transporter TAXI family solute receptor
MRRYVKEILLLASAVGLMLLALFWLWPDPIPKMQRLKMTAGDATGLRHQLALELAQKAHEAGLEIEVIPTSGSRDAIEGLRSGELDLAFVQGGLASEPASGIFQLTPMHVEPLHLVVSSELAIECDTRGLDALRGRTVNLGPPGSGTYALASAVLTFAGLDPETQQEQASAGVLASNLSYSELLELPTERLPDAIFTVSSLPSPVVDELVEQHGYRLVALPFAEAIALEATLQQGTSIAADSVNKRHIFEARIPAFTYSVQRAEPPENLSTIGTRLLLLAGEKLSNETVIGILGALYRSDFATVERPPIEASLLELPSEFKMHPGSQHYRQRNRPLIAGEIIDYWEKVIAITATVMGGTFFMVQWYMRWSRRKQEASFASYMERVLTIEQTSMHTELSDSLDLATLVQLQRELAEIKTEAIRKFASGDLEGEGMVNGFLALVNDSRNQLTRLILHERENIEEQAAQLEIDAKQIWKEHAQSRPKPKSNSI